MLVRSITEMMYISSATIRIRTKRFCQGGSATVVPDIASLFPRSFMMSLRATQRRSNPRPEALADRNIAWLHVPDRARPRAARMIT
jgi:hypothetical protein